MPTDTDMREFDDLIAALRDERPEIDPAFARELDNRAAAGFATPRRRLRFPRISLMVGAPAAAFSVLIAVVVAAGLLGGGGEDESATSARGEVTAMEQAPQQDDGSAAATRELQPLPEDAVATSQGEATDSTSADAVRAFGQAAAPPAAAVVGGRRGRVQEQSAQLTLAAPAREISDVGDEIFGVVDQVGGFVVSSSVRATDGNGGSGDFQLRIPTTRLEDGIARLSRLAHVRSREQGVLDITVERNVARERLEEGRAERVSLLNRLAAATTETEAEAIKAQINNINAVIGRARADLRRVLRRAQFAAVGVTLVAKGDDGEVPPGDDGKWTPGDALRDAVRVLEVAAGVLLIAGAVLIPLALLAGAFAATRRVAGRRGRERVLDAV